MKLRYIFSSILASVLLFAGCVNENTDSLPNIKLSQTYLSISSEGGQAKVTVNATEAWEFVVNDTWPSVIKRDKDGNITSETPSWLAVDKMNGAEGETTLTFSADASEDGRELELSIKVGDYTQYLRVRQGKLGASQATCAEVIAGPDSKTYRVKGTCTSISNTTYGNWYLNDGTGELYIYGTLDKDGLEKNFLSLGLEVGDVVEVEGPKTTYGSTIELVNVTVIKITKSLVKVMTESATYDKEGDEFEVKVAYKGDNCNPKVADSCTDWASILSVNTIKGTPSKLEQNPADTCVVTVKLAANEGGNRNGAIEFTSGSSSVKYEFEQEGSIIAANASEINAAEDGTTLYRITAYVSKVEDADSGKLYLKDATGELYVYKIADFAESGVKEGDIVTIVGQKGSYKGSPQLINSKVEAREEVKDIKAAAFKALADDAHTWYRLTGKVTKSTEDNTKFDLETYGNFALEDETGNVYVYGVVPGYGGASKQFGTLGVKEGDIITIVAHKGSYGDLNQASKAFYVAHEAGTAPEEPEQPVDPGTPGDENPYAISLEYTLGSQAYEDGIATINGTAEQKVLKIGSSSKAGSITFKVPGSAKTLSFYAVAWKDKATTLEFYAGETLLGEQAIVANSGATGTGSYTITVADSDKYTLDCSALTEDTEINVTTKSGANTRAILFGIQAK